jgi:cytosine/adenosine deaminase-related metal-dependent hydrolase
MGSVEGSSVTVDILRRTGIKAHAANSLMDKGADCLARDPGWLEEESRRVRSSCGGLVRYAAAPRFALSCSDEIWRMVSGLPGTILRTTHCAESPDELDDPAIAHDGGNVRFLEKRGFLGPGTVLAHCIHLAHGEVDILSESGTAVAHCPWANLRLGSGIADAATLMDAGIPVFPASDGAACNNRLDLSSDIRLAMSLMSFRRSPQSVSGRAWMKAATELAGGFLGTRHGRLAPGFDADIVVIDPGEEETEELARAEDPLRYLLELDWASRIRLVLVRGRVLFENGGFPTLPVAPMSVAEARSEVLARAGIR